MIKHWSVSAFRGEFTNGVFFYQRKNLHVVRNMDWEELNKIKQHLFLAMTLAIEQPTPIDQYTKCTVAKTRCTHTKMHAQHIVSLDAPFFLICGLI